MDDLFTITVGEEPGARVECRGEMDICALPDLEAALDAAIRRRHGDLRVGMAGVRYIDSACIKALLVARQSVADTGGRLRLEEPSPVVQRALRLLSLAGHFGLAT